MLMDKINLTEKTIENYQELENFIKRSEDYKKLDDKINSCRYEITIFKRLVTDLIKLDKDIIKNANLKEILDDANKLEKTFAEGISYCEEYVSKIFGKTRSQRAVLKNEWTHYFSKNFSSILNTLNIIKWVSVNDEMMSLVKGINDIGLKWPINQTDIEKLQQYTQKAERIIEKLDVNSDVQNFLRLIATGNATLKDLSPEILKWLVDNEFDKSIKLDFSAKN